MASALASFLLRCLSFLPRPLSGALGRMIGLLNYRLDTRAAGVTRENLRLCLPGSDLERMTRESLIATGRTVMETPAVWLGDLARLDRWVVEVHNEPLLLAGVASPKGLLLLLPHLGNWELFNAYYRRYGMLTALYQPPRQSWLRPIMARVRDRHGNRLVPAGSRGIVRLRKTLGAGGTVVVLPDQVPANGVYAPFYGHQALTDRLSGRLLQKTGANVLGVAVLRRPDGFFEVHVLAPPPEIHDPDPGRAAAAVNRLVETCIALAPAQYQWEYKRFRERPAGEARLYRFHKPPELH